MNKKQSSIDQIINDIQESNETNEFGIVHNEINDRFIEKMKKKNN